MSINVTGDMIRIRATEADRKVGLTFADLCELVDQGRQRGVAPASAVLGASWLKNVKDRDGYLMKFLEAVAEPTPAKLTDGQYSDGSYGAIER